MCFIGAVPATDRLTGVHLGDSGPIPTDAALADPGIDAVFDRLGRRPLPFETSRPGVFAVGDVRAGSMNRVAAAVDEGASAVRSAHVALGPVVPSGAVQAGPLRSGPNSSGGASEPGDFSASWAEHHASTARGCPAAAFGRGNGR